MQEVLTALMHMSVENIFCQVCFLCDLQNAACFLLEQLRNQSVKPLVGDSCSVTPQSAYDHSAASGHVASRCEDAARYDQIQPNDVWRACQLGGLQPLATASEQAGLLSVCESRRLCTRLFFRPASRLRARPDGGADPICFELWQSC